MKEKDGQVGLTKESAATTTRSKVARGEEGQKVFPIS